MTDKQINYEQNSVIIDGVDVSKCACFDDGECLNPCETVANCEASPNCHYKQLKRKEQECEELKKEQAEIKKYLGISHKTILERLKELTEFRDRDRDEMFQLEQQLDLLESENKDLENQLKREKERFKKQDKFSAMFIQDLKNEKSNLVNVYLEKIGQLLSENEGLKEKIMYLESEIDRLNG